MNVNLWGAHAPRVLVSAPSPKQSSCREAKQLTKKKFAMTGRHRQHARARALPRKLSSHHLA